MNPKISIIIPTYNRADYLKQTIESALAQDYDNYEVIVSDNASTDNTQEVIKKYLDNSNFKYHKNEKNIGMVKNWHKALYEYTKGDWFLILSDDDYFIDNTYLTQAVSLMKKDKDIHIVYANGYIKYEDTGEMVPLELPFNEINEGKKIFLSRGTVKPQDFTLCNILFKRDEALKFKPFENEFNISCDSELFLKMCIYGKVGIVKEFASVYRVHSNNLVKEVKKSWNLFLNNLDFILEPYVEANKSGFFTKEEISIFEQSWFFPVLRDNMAKAKVYFPSKYLVYCDYIKSKDNALLEKLFLYTRYDFKTMIANVSMLYKTLLYIKNKFK